MKFQVAGKEHWKDLSDLCRNSSMPGWIRLALGRDPDFFQGLSVQGTFNQVLIAVEEDRLVAMGCRSIKPAWINGQRAEIGYLSGLRLVPEVRRTGALARAYAACKALHAQKPVPAYLTTVVERNTEVMKVLTSGRAGLPHYLDHGRYFTYAVNLNLRRRRKYPGGLEIRRGRDVPLENITAFLNRYGARRQFFPVIGPEDFGADYLRGLCPADFRVAVRDGNEISGVAAVWDQGGFKQNIVQGYTAPVRIFRPVINGVLRMAGFRPLPVPGEKLDMLYLAFCCVRDDNPDTLRAILEQIYAERQTGAHHFLVLGFHERDPLRAAMTHFLSFRYTSRVYLVCWDDGLDFARSLDPVGIPHLEVATL